MARLLITTFNGPDKRTGAALHFKSKASGAGLLNDLLDEDQDQFGKKSLWDAWPAELHKLVDLRYSPPQPQNSRLFAFMRLCPTWRRVFDAPDNLLRTWISKFYEKEVHCWVVGGHHHGHLVTGSMPPSAEKPRYSAMLWGTPDRAIGSLYRPYAGFGINVETRDLEWFGYREPDKPSDPLTLQIQGARAKLQHCRLMVILGCNGVPTRYDKDRERWLWTMGPTWQEWLETVDRTPPMIVGWYSTKSMPRDEQPEPRRFATDKFIEKLAALTKPNPPVASRSTDHFLDLFKDKKNWQQVLHCWGAACCEAFHDVKPSGGPPYRNLWTECGVLAPDKEVWHANTKIPVETLQTKPPFDLDAKKTLPLEQIYPST